MQPCTGYIPFPWILSAHKQVVPKQEKDLLKCSWCDTPISLPYINGLSVTLECIYFFSFFHCPHQVDLPLLPTYFSLERNSAATVLLQLCQPTPKRIFKVTSHSMGPVFPLPFKLSYLIFTDTNKLFAFSWSL